VSSLNDSLIEPHHIRNRSTTTSQDKPKDTIESTTIIVSKETRTILRNELNIFSGSLVSDKLTKTILKCELGCALLFSKLR
jgi:hypothetical protein